MKELSIEEKAKRYDEAIERAKKHCADYVVETIFPELKESEDERIRKSITEFFKNYSKNGTYKAIPDVTKWIAWLEKQGEQKPVQETEPTPIFKIGNILKRKGKDYTFRVDRIHYGYYYCDRNHGAFFPIEEQGNWELVEQNPADKVEQKGMNLVEEEMTPFQKKVFCIIDTTIEEELGLKQVCDELLALASNEIKQNPAWSEEDDTFFKAIIRDIENTQYISEDAKKDRIKWLKSIKYRVQPKQEWSEEDEKLLKLSLENLTELKQVYGEKYGRVGDCINWLISLRPQINVTDEELVQAKKDAYNEALDKIEYHSGEPTFNDGWSAAIWYLKKRNAQFKNT